MRDKTTPGGKTVPADVIKTAVRAGRDAGDGSEDRGVLTAVAMATVDALGEAKLRAAQQYKAGDRPDPTNPHDYDDSDQCEARLYDSSGMRRWSCTWTEEDHEDKDLPHVAGDTRQICAVWSDMDD